MALGTEVISKLFSGNNANRKKGLSQIYSMQEGSVRD